MVVKIDIFSVLYSAKWIKMAVIVIVVVIGYCHCILVACTEQALRAYFRWSIVISRNFTTQCTVYMWSDVLFISCVSCLCWVTDLCCQFYILHLNPYIGYERETELGWPHTKWYNFKVWPQLIQTELLSMMMISSYNEFIVNLRAFQPPVSLSIENLVIL